MDDEEDNECLPIPRRSLANRRRNYFGSDDEHSPTDRRKSRLLLNNSITSDHSIDETIQTPIQLITLYEKTVECAAKNKINAKNAFHFPFVERLPEILNIIAFDDTINAHHEPNFVKAGSVIDTSAKIYGYRVDGLHAETQKLNESIQQKEAELGLLESDAIELPKKINQRSKLKASSYLATDISTISLSYEFQFHPFQPSHMCHWPGGVGIDSLYADMVSYTMYSSSDFPLINGFIDLNNRVNKEYDDNERILDASMRTNYDLIPLRDVIKDNEGLDHVLGCQTLREFSFNEESTESYIETIDECSIIDQSLMSVDENDDQHISDEMYSNGLSELRDDPTNFYFQELQSAHTFPTTVVSMDVTLMQSKISFVDCIPHLLREKTDPSEYSYFDLSKLKLFAGPHLWKYTNLLPETMKTNSIPDPKPSRTPSTHHFKLELFSQDKIQSLHELMSVHSWSRTSLKKPKRKLLPTTLKKSRSFHFPEKSHYQLKLSRRIRSINDLSSLNYFPNYDHLQISSTIDEDYHPMDDQSDPIDHEDPFPEQLQYDFIRPIHYEKIEYDKNTSKIDAKKLQLQLNDEYNREYIHTSDPISLSTLCIKLLDQGIISFEKDQIVSAFYCMLNNCHKNHLYMKNNSQRDDLIIEKQSMIDSTPLTYI